MIVFDGIVFSLQTSGGISVLFREILSRLPEASFALYGFEEHSPVEAARNSYQSQHWRRMERYRRAIVPQVYDIFHSTYYRLPARGSGRIVTTVHDYVYEHFSVGVRRVVHSLQKKKAIAESDGIICVSKNTKRDLLEACGPSWEERTTVVYNGVSSEYFFIPDRDIQSQVLFVGARGGYKNFASVVRALATTMDLRLVCVGGGPFRRQEMDLLERHIRGRYRHAGYLKNAELNHEYNRSVCLVYPSLYEGFGIPILEAMRAGCPVIAVNRSAVPEIAGDAAILMEEGNPDEIRQAIEWIRSTETREELIRRGQRQAADFSWERTFNQTVAVYERLIGKSLPKVGS